MEGQDHGMGGRTTSGGQDHVGRCTLCILGLSKGLYLGHADRLSALGMHCTLAASPAPGGP